MMNNHIVPQSEHLLQDACYIIEQAKSIAFKAVNDTLVKRNWLLGMRIQHEVLQDQRAEYGEQVIRNLAKEDSFTKFPKRLKQAVSDNIEKNVIFNADFKDDFKEFLGNGYVCGNVIVVAKN